MATTTEPGVDVVDAFTNYRLPLTRLAVMLVDDLSSAEDVVQDAFLALHRHHGALREQATLYSYLRRAVVNNAHNLLRRRGIARRPLGHSQTTAAPADEKLLLAEEQRAVPFAIGQASPRPRSPRRWASLAAA